MKVERSQPEVFNPVVITLTSQEEVDALRAILGRVVTGEVEGNTFDLYNALTPHASRRPKAYASGTLYLKNESGGVEF